MHAGRHLGAHTVNAFIVHRDATKCPIAAAAAAVDEDLSAHGSGLRRLVVTLQRTDDPLPCRHVDSAITFRNDRIGLAWVVDGDGAVILRPGLVAGAIPALRCPAVAFHKLVLLRCKPKPDRPAAVLKQLALREVQDPASRLPDDDEPASMQPGILRSKLPRVRRRKRRSSRGTPHRHYCRC